MPWLPSQFKLKAKTFLLIGALILSFSYFPITAFAQSLDFDPTVRRPSAKPSSSFTALDAIPSRSPELNPYLPKKAVKQSSNETSIKPFELTVTQTRFLPDAMYGRWSVTAKLTKSDLPGGTPELSYNNWSLEQINDQVFISNIDNGAKAGISVDEVKDRTATFHHKVILPDRNPLRVLFGKPSAEADRDFMIEQPTVTVDGDRMIGKTIQRFYHIKNGEIVRVFTAEFLLHAERLTNGRVKMGGAQHDLDFEIEDIQLESDVESDENDLSTPETIDSALYSR